MIGRSERCVRIRHCKNSTWRKRKVCRHLPFAKNAITTKTTAARFHIARQWEASFILGQQRALTSHSPMPSYLPRIRCITKFQKNIEVRQFDVRERYLSDDIGIEHTDGRKQLADLLTKPTEPVAFEMLCCEIWITSGEQWSDMCSVCFITVLEEVISLKHFTLDACGVCLMCVHLQCILDYAPSCCCTPLFYCLCDVH